MNTHDFKAMAKTCNACGAKMNPKVAWVNDTFVVTAECFKCQAKIKLTFVITALPKIERGGGVDFHKQSFSIE